MVSNDRTDITIHKLTGIISSSNIQMKYRSGIMIRSLHIEQAIQVKRLESGIKQLWDYMVTCLTPDIR